MRDDSNVVRLPPELIARERIAMERMLFERAQAHGLGGQKQLNNMRASMTPVEPRLGEDGDHPARMFAWIVVGLIFWLVIAWVFIKPVFAMDHGWDKDSPFAQWVDGLKRPETNYKYSCCGKGDMYGIRIDEDAIGDEGNAMGTAVVTDGEQITYPDHDVRSPIENGTAFRFPKNTVNDRQGNPSKTAYAFLTVSEGHITHVWCVIPLPPNS